MSPDFPKPVPRGQFCSWSITVAPNYQVSLKFKVFSPYGNDTEELEVFDGGNETAPTLDVFTGNNPPPAFGVNSTSNHMYIVLKSTSKLVTSTDKAKGIFFAEFTKRGNRNTVLE